MKSPSILRRALSLVLSVIMLTGLLTLSAAATEKNPKVYASEGDTIEVVAETLNIRSGPGTQYPRLGTLGSGYTALLQKIDGDWGRLDCGWINLNYVKVNNRSSSNGFVPKDDYSPNNAYVTANFLNIRSGPGTNYASLGLLGNGTRIFIQKKENGWGKIEQGWVDLDYVKFSDSGSSSSTVATGSRVRVVATTLNIRQGAGTGYARVGTLNYGDVVEVLEIKGNWGRISSGWICLTYTTASTTPVTPAAPAGSNNSRIVSGSDVEVTAASLRVRLGASSDAKILGYLGKGTVVNVIDVVGGWGRINEGWIDLSYVRPL